MTAEGKQYVVEVLEFSIHARPMNGDLITDH